jgi:hypothetical protein
MVRMLVAFGGRPFFAFPAVKPPKVAVGIRRWGRGIDSLTHHYPIRLGSGKVLLQKVGGTKLRIAIKE